MKVEIICDHCEEEHREVDIESIADVSTIKCPVCNSSKIWIHNIKDN